MFPFLPCILILSCQLSVLSCVNLSGEYSSDMTLTTSESPYNIKGDVIFRGNINIENGVEILFDTDANIYFYSILNCGCYDYDTTSITDIMGLADKTQYVDIRPSHSSNKRGELYMRGSSVQFCNTKLDRLNAGIIINSDLNSVIIDNCLFQNMNWDDIVFAFAPATISNVDITDNEFTDSGIRSIFQNGGRVTDINIVHNSWININLEKDGYINDSIISFEENYSGSQNIYIGYNEFVNNTATLNIYLKYAGNYIIEYNQFINNTVFDSGENGENSLINVYYSDDGIVRYNLFKYNTVKQKNYDHPEYALFYSSRSDNLYFGHNQYIDNYIDFKTSKQGYINAIWFYYGENIVIEFNKFGKLINLKTDPDIQYHVACFFLVKIDGQFDIKYNDFNIDAIDTITTRRRRLPDASVTPIGWYFYLKDSRPNRDTNINITYNNLHQHNYVLDVIAFENWDWDISATNNYYGGMNTLSNISRQIDDRCYHPTTSIGYVTFWPILVSPIDFSDPTNVIIPASCEWNGNPTFCAYTETSCTLPTTLFPTSGPMPSPTSIPTTIPTSNPLSLPTKSPSETPTLNPTTSNPTETPTVSPSPNPSTSPSKTPTKYPTVTPSWSPTKFGDTRSPTVSPITKAPTSDPTIDPTMIPSMVPTEDPTVDLSSGPLIPSKDPTTQPTLEPVEISSTTTTLTTTEAQYTSDAAKKDEIPKDGVYLNWTMIYIIIALTVVCCIFIILLTVIYCLYKRLRGRKESQVMIKVITNVNTTTNTDINTNTRFMNQYSGITDASPIPKGDIHSPVEPTPNSKDAFEDSDSHGGTDMFGTIQTPGEIIGGQTKFSEYEKDLHVQNAGDTPSDIVPKLLHVTSKGDQQFAEGGNIFNDGQGYHGYGQSDEDMMSMYAVSPGRNHSRVMSGFMTSGTTTKGHSSNQISLEMMNYKCGRLPPSPPPRRQQNNFQSNLNQQYVE